MGTRVGAIGPIVGILVALAGMLVRGTGVGRTSDALIACVVTTVSTVGIVAAIVGVWTS
jgi:hypothetical protein